MSDTRVQLRALLKYVGDNIMEFKTDNFTESLADYLISHGVTIVPDSNVGNIPLTLDELQQMAGEPIWVENSSEKHAEGFTDEWALVSTSPHARVVESTRTIYRLEYYGKTWVAYRRKPKEE